MKKLLLLLSFFLLSKLLFAQSSEVVKKYIETYKDIAIEEMQRTGVPAAITLAQGIHETEAGQSVLVRKSNNHFGIKCKTEWKGQSVSHDDDARGECFRKYDDPKDSYRDHSDFLKNRPFYTSLFRLDPTDYEAWAYGLKKAGYATNPKYAQLLIKIIRDYQLQEYTLLGLESKKAGNDVVWTKEVKTNEISEISNDDYTEEKPNYPSGVFRINETRVTFITKGTSFLKIADENNISLSRLFEFNDMKPVDVASQDQLIYLQRKRKKGANEFHIVANRETLYDIAQKEGIRFENLLQYNFLKEDMRPQVGEKLYLHEQAPAMPKLAGLIKESFSTPIVLEDASSDAAKDNYVIHVVQPKETVYAIAKKYSVTIEDVMKWNDLQTIDLKTGQQLRISKKSMNAN